MELSEFLDLPSQAIADLARKAGPQVCGFPINGTRRWYLLEKNNNSNYLEVICNRHVEIYRMLFEHGLDTILAPVFGSELLNRGQEYLRLAIEGMTWLTTSPIFLDFYRAYGVRVHFYGNYRKRLATTSSSALADTFDQLTEDTKGNERYRIFFGVFADDSIEAISEMSGRYYCKYGSPASARTLEELFYGEAVGPVSLFIGFDKFSMFDMPLVPTENTDLYFTANPSLYLSQRQLRSILYDHLFTRSAPEPDYEQLSPGAIRKMKEFYYANGETAFGVGLLRDGIWYPRMANGLSDLQ